MLTGIVKRSLKGSTENKNKIRLWISILIDIQVNVRPMKIDSNGIHRVIGWFFECFTKERRIEWV